jgi:hypothetical protein
MMSVSLISVEKTGAAPARTVKERTYDEGTNRYGLTGYSLLEILLYRYTGE